MKIKYCFQVCFIGPEGSEGKLEKSALKIPDTRLRAEVIFNYLMIAHVLHGELPPPAIDEVKQMLIGDATQAALPLKNADHITDNSLELKLQAQSTDVAGIRTAANDDNADEDARDETVNGTDIEEPEPHLVPVGAMQLPRQDMSTIIGNIAEAMKKTDEGDTSGPKNDEADTNSADEDDNSGATKKDTDTSGVSGGHINMKRGKNPHNDYGRQPTTLYEAFWPLFLLRRGFEEFKPLPDVKYRHLFLYYDSRFAHDMALLFKLANDKMRHEVNKGVAARVTSSSRCFREFTETINDPSFQDLLKEAQEETDGKGPASRIVVKKVLRFLQLSSRNVEFGKGKRSGEFTKLMAFHRFGGPASVFFNIAPDDVHNQQVVRHSYEFTGYGKFPATIDNDNGEGSNFLKALRGLTRDDRVISDSNAPGGTYNMSESALQMLVAKNPIAATLIFVRTTHNLFRHLLQLPLHKDLKKNVLIRGAGEGEGKKKGVIGVMKNASAVWENNKRGSSHQHAQGRNGATPRVIADVASHPRARASLIGGIDTQFETESPLEYHAADIARKVLKVTRWLHFLS